MRIIKFVPLLGLLLLTNCAALSGPSDPVAEPKPLAQDAAICAYSNEEPKLEGAIPKPQNEEEAAGINAFLSYVAVLIDFGREADRVANIAKEECLSRVRGKPAPNKPDTE